jgi:flagellar biosynthetic protein FliQ
MSASIAIDIARHALYLTALISGPMLLFSLVIGLLVGIFQAVTQIHEMTLTFIPKIVVIGLTLILFLPWMLNMFVDYTVHLFSIIPEVIR